MIVTYDDYLAHHGVKGMKWGVRKEENGSAGKLTPKQKDMAKKVAIGTAVLVVIAGAIYTGQKIHTNSTLTVADISKSPLADKGRSFVEKQAKEQTDIIYASRGKERGFRFLKNGNLDDPLQKFHDAFGSDSESHDGMFKRMEDGSIATAFMDLEGRKDRSTRLIPHQMIIPKSMTDGLNSVEDVKAKIWPQLKDQYAEFYTSQPQGFT